MDHIDFMLKTCHGKPERQYLVDSVRQSRLGLRPSSGTASFDSAAFSFDSASFSFNGDLVTPATRASGKGNGKVANFPLPLARDRKTAYIGLALARDRKTAEALGGDMFKLFVADCKVEPTISTTAEIDIQLNTMEGKRFPLRCAYDISFPDLQAAVADVCGIPPHFQSLFKHGDETPMKSQAQLGPLFGLQSGASLYLLVSKGGPFVVIWYSTVLGCNQGSYKAKGFGADDFESADAFFNQRTVDKSVQKSCDQQDGAEQGVGCVIMRHGSEVVKRSAGGLLCEQLEAFATSMYVGAFFQDVDGAVVDLTEPELTIHDYSAFSASMTEKIPSACGGVGGNYASQAEAAAYTGAGALGAGPSPPQCPPARGRGQQPARDAAGALREEARTGRAMTKQEYAAWVGADADH